MLKKKKRTHGVMGMDGGDGYTTMWKHLIPLNCTLKNGKFYIMFNTI